MRTQLSHTLVAVLAITVLASPLAAATIIVDASGGGDHTSVVDAVGASAPGDTILLRPGVYEEADVTVSHGLTIRGEDRESCVIDGRQESSLFYCHLLEGTEGIVTFENLTMTRGCSPHDGGAIHWWSGSSAELRVRSATFRENQAGSGACVYIWAAACASFEDCLFTANEAAVGAVASIQGCGPVSFLRCSMTGNNTSLGVISTSVITMQAVESTRLEDCVLTRNGSSQGMSNVLFFLDDPPEVVCCTIAGNLSASGGMAVVSTYQPEAGAMENVIIAFNEGMVASGGEYEFMSMTDCCIFANAENDSVMCQETNCHRVDPLFCGLESGDFTLCADSPCLPGAGAWGALVGAAGQGCDECGSAVVPLSWGVLKALYRERVRPPNRRLHLSG